MSAPVIVLAITGASGSIYAVRLLDVLLRAGCHVHLLISSAGAAVIKQELGVAVDLDHFQPELLVGGDRSMPDDALTEHRWLRRPTRPASSASTSAKNVFGVKGQLFYHHYRDFMAPVASGSFRTSGMVICPCSGSTIGAVTRGTGDNLIHRAAEVHFKERRRLVLVPRETPVSTLQLENLLRASQAGAVVLPASPGFYHGVESIADLVDFIVARVCDQFGVDHELMRRWGERQ